MKKLLLTILLLGAVEAKADGCWLNFNTGQCESVYCYLNNYPLNYVLYGGAVGDLCSFWGQAEASSAYWQGYSSGVLINLAKQKTLVKKLKRACGSRCRNIR